MDTVLAVAAEVEAPPAQVAMAWIRERARRSPTAVIPVIGPRTPEHLDSYLAALDVSMSPEQYAALDAASAPSLGFPHDAVAERAKALFGAGTVFDRLGPVG